MDPRNLVVAIGFGLITIGLFFVREQIAEAIRRGPWGGGPPPPVGPLGAADPFRRKLKKPQFLG